MPFLIADEIGVSEGAVTATVDKAVQVDFFNANMFEQYSVLTSAGIQTRFFEAVRRRSVARYDARFLLINVSVYKNAVSVDNNPVNVGDNRQRKVKERKVKERKGKNDVVRDTAPPPPPYEAFRIYANNIHPVSSEIEKDRLLDLIDHYGDVRPSKERSCGTSGIWATLSAFCGVGRPKDMTTTPLITPGIPNIPSERQVSSRLFLLYRI